jgi:hypothetical protein
MRSKNVTAFPRITYNRFISRRRGFDVATSSLRQASSTHKPLLDMKAEAPASACAVTCSGCIPVCVRNSPLFAGLPPLAHREQIPFLLTGIFSSGPRANMDPFLRWTRGFTSLPLSSLTFHWPA